MMHLAVIGAPIAHSLSPNLHYAFARQAGIQLKYSRILLDEVQFEAQVHDFFDAGGVGLSVTSPGKRRAFELAQIRTRRSIASGAANTLWRDKRGRIHADNTDGIGLIADLAQKKVVIQNAHILILGAGGAVCNILPSLIDASPKAIHLSNRTHTKAQTLCKAFNAPCLKATERTDDMAYDLVLHATSMREAASYPLIGHPFCYDLSYDISGVTPFTQFAHKQGLLACDGFGMLIAQAKAAFQCFMQQDRSN